MIAKIIFLIVILLIVRAFYKLYKYRNIYQIDYEKVKTIQKDPGLLILDVRTPGEFKRGYILKAVNIPLNRLKTAIVKNKIPKSSKIIVVCRSGARSNKAALILQKSGYKNIYNLTGGMLKLKR